MVIKTYWDLDFWETGEWQACEEKINDRASSINPSRDKTFAALRETPLSSVRVAIFGQDPYPDPDMCTGLAFSLPEGSKTIPPTLHTIYDEYASDLHYPPPVTGFLLPWAKQGVLLWNVIPVCEKWKSMSCDWVEWEFLNRELIEKLKEKGVVFVFLGGRARSYITKDLYEAKNCRVIEASHPSPRASRSANNPFIGSRIFSRINQALNEIGLETIEWRLP